MNRKAALCIMFASFIILTDGNNVTLLPDGIAYVISGKPLTLQCVYSGTYNPFTFNFYLNPDTNGIHISISDCMIASAVGYNTNLYNQSCGTNNVSLIILAVSQEQNGQKWECDVSFIAVVPLPPKASTIINVTAPTTSTTRSMIENGSQIGAIVGGTVGGVVAVILIVFLIYYIYKKVMKDKTKNSGSSSAVSREQVQVQMGNKGVKDDEEERPPAVHTRTQNKVEPNTNSKKTNDRQQPVPPANTGFEDTPTFRRLPQPPQNGEIKDRSLRGISATIDDTPDLASETPRPNRLRPLTPKQATVQKEDASEEPKKKRKKKRKKDQMNVENPEEENGETDLRVN